MAGDSNNADAAESKSRVLIMGKSENDLADNAVYTSKYSLFSFLPIVSTVLDVVVSQNEKSLIA